MNLASIAIQPGPNAERIREILENLDRELDYLRSINTSLSVLYLSTPGGVLASIDDYVLWCKDDPADRGPVVVYVGGKRLTAQEYLDRLKWYALSLRAFGVREER